MPTLASLLVLQVVTIMASCKTEETAVALAMELLESCNKPSILSYEVCAWLLCWYQLYHQAMIQ